MTGKILRGWKFRDDEAHGQWCISALGLNGVDGPAVFGNFGASVRAYLNGSKSSREIVMIRYLPFGCYATK